MVQIADLVFKFGCNNASVLTQFLQAPALMMLLQSLARLLNLSASLKGSKLWTSHGLWPMSFLMITFGLSLIVDVLLHFRLMLLPCMRPAHGMGNTARASGWWCSLFRLVSCSLVHGRLYSSSGHIHVLCTACCLAWPFIPPIPWKSLFFVAQ